MTRVLNFLLLCGLVSALVPTRSLRAWAQSPEPLGRLQADGLQVEGTLQLGDGELPDGSFFDVYEFTGQANQAVTLLLESEDFDSLGLTYAYLGDYEQASDFQAKALDIARQIGDRLGESVAMANLGNVYAALGDYPRAIDSQDQSLVIARQIGDRQGAARTLSNLGRVYDALADYPRAIDLNQQAIEIARQIDNRQLEATSLGNLGTAYAALGDYSRAIDLHAQALDIFRQIGDRQGEAIASELPTQLRAREQLY